MRCAWTWTRWWSPPRGLAELHRANFHSCGTVPPHGEKLLQHPDDEFYLAGMKSYGRAPTFPAGHRVRAGPLTDRRRPRGDRAAADLVRAEPARHRCVCSTDLALEAEDETGGSCCGTAPAEPQLVTLGIGAPTGFATGVVHGRSGDEPAPTSTCG